MRDVAIRKADAQDSRLAQQVAIGEMLDDSGSESTGEDVLLDRDEDVVAGSQPLDQLGVERLGETRVGDCRAHPVLA